MESPRGVQPAFAGQRSAHSTAVSTLASRSPSTKMEIWWTEPEKIDFCPLIDRFRGRD